MEQSRFLVSTATGFIPGFDWSRFNLSIISAIHLKEINNFHLNMQLIQKELYYIYIKKKSPLAHPPLCIMCSK